MSPSPKPACADLLIGFVLLVLASSASASPQKGNAGRNDCIATASRYHGVNEIVLRAIAWHESKMDAWAVRKNSNGTYDIGRMQTNSVHRDELAKYGIAPSHLLDPCISAYVGAWMYKKKINKHGNTWAAVGAYHSETPARRDAYSRAIYGILVNWGQIPSALTR